MSIYFVQVGVHGVYETTVDAPDEYEAFEMAATEMEDAACTDGFFGAGLTQTVDYVDLVEEDCEDCNDTALD